MVRLDAVSAIALCFAAAACGGRQPSEATRVAPASGRVKALADTYLDGFFARNPDQVTLYGVPGRRHDKLPDNSLDARRAWQAKEDGWLNEARQIDAAAVDRPAMRAKYAIVRQA